MMMVSRNNARLLEGEASHRPAVGLLGLEI
jgi:hypothetical protein